MSKAFSSIHFQCSSHDGTEDICQRLKKRYGHASLDEADVIVALGGDGFMLHSLHRYVDAGIPIYGMKRGSVGFLMNRFEEEGLPERLQVAQPVELNPLRMEASTEAGGQATALAINEVSLLRQTNQAAKIRILVNDAVKIDELICDGVLLSTTAGSTAYNFSAHGPILPLGTEALALTPISPFRPRRFRGAILPSAVKVTFEVLDFYKRPVSATADAQEVRNVVQVDITEDKTVTHCLLFDPDHSLEERILNEQFL